MILYIYYPNFLIINMSHLFNCRTNNWYKEKPMKISQTHVGFIKPLVFLRPRNITCECWINILQSPSPYILIESDFFCWCVVFSLSLMTCLLLLKYVWYVNMFIKCLSTCRIMYGIKCHNSFKGKSAYLVNIRFLILLIHNFIKKTIYILNI